MSSPAYIDNLYECTECNFSDRCSKVNGCMEECLDYFRCVEDEEEITHLINLIIENYHEEICNEWSLYTILSYTFTVNDKLASEFLSDSWIYYFREDEIEEIKELLNSNRILQIKIREIWEIIDKIKQKLSVLIIQKDYLDDIGLVESQIRKENITLVIYFMIQNKLVNKYSSIWEQNYDNSFDFCEYYKEGYYRKEKYVKDCFSKGILTDYDMNGIISVSYFLVQKSPFRIWWDNWADAISVLHDIRNMILWDKIVSHVNLKQNEINNILSKSIKNHHYIAEKDSLDILLEQLNSLVGLYEVKKDVTSLINFLKIHKMREKRGLKQIPISLHLVFSGNPGTGKTTVARLLAKIYHQLEVLSKGHLIEVDRSGLVAGYVGQTAIKTQKVIQEALGGILFIDEAYSLTVNRGENDFGFEAVDTLLKGMEDHRDDLIVIVAGYPDLMNKFLNSNPGLRSRFNKFINFTDYTSQELVEIFKIFCNTAEYTANEECINHVEKYFKQRCKEKINFANGRDVRNYFEMAIVNQANRLSMVKDINDKILSELKLEDVEDIIL